MIDVELVVMAALVVIGLMLVMAAVMVVVEFSFSFHSNLFRILHVLYRLCIKESYVVFS